MRRGGGAGGGAANAAPALRAAGLLAGGGGGAIAGVALLAWGTKLQRVGLFWAAFVLTRPLGATLGDFLDKPVQAGGLALGRFEASSVLMALMVLVMLVLPEGRAGARR